MSAAEALAQIKSLRAQIDVLEAMLRKSPPGPSYTAADLYGLLKGQADSLPEEIDAALYRMPHDPEP